ncbi:hypothetical protein [Laspinema olomoucense]|uniref:Transposase n=1 Tax=Laspinema olomoucense D3b TaxID=2953688 RepID=A0ABT2NCG1_9CYAN|nr:MULTISPECIES: hypothetical protein [unclassified Laspinema]MCT7971499.1 hypothetical protein [Laspinema sp. D3d]MCT7980176.1 hypothetical protein [Laspinema sp. D3b]MCT7987369.1 hypothetical protein [Laspinema sp. D3a]
MALNGALARLKNRKGKMTNPEVNPRWHNPRIKKYPQILAVMAIATACVTNHRKFPTAIAGV